MSEQVVRICIKAWNNVIVQHHNGYSYDQELEALDSIRFGPSHEVEETSTDIFDNLLDEFKMHNPDFYFDNASLVIEE